MSAEQGDLLADLGMERAAQAADEAWLLAAKRVVWALIREGEGFTTDAIWYRLEALGVSTSEGRALGAVMKAASRQGWITHTGSYFKSTRPECHGRPIPLWLPTGKAQAA